VLHFQLSDRYPFLGSGQGTLTAYLQRPIHNDSQEPEAKPALLILPGGGYVCCCSHREGWPIAMSFSELGIQCFVLEYSVAPGHRWPQALLEVSAALDLIRENACIHVHPYGAITMGLKGEVLADLEGMAADVAGFSDDGKGVQADSMMRSAMEKAKALDKIIVAHCEVNELLKGGYIHDGDYARQHGHRGICSESEWVQIARDLELVEQIGCKYHVCHISTKESVDIIRKAKARGVNVTCETGPHYLVMDDSMLKEEGRFKMNPPLRSKEDRDALILGLQDGTIDMIATDHAPHSAEEKSRGLEGSAFGVVGIETAFPICYTYLVKTGIITLEKLMDLLVTNPRSRFGLPVGGDFSVWDLEAEGIVDPQDFLSMGKATPFEGWPIQGKCLTTVCDGKQVYTAY
jgi:dihydroorotase